MALVDPQADALKALVLRLRLDGGRYLLSVALTREERDAMPEPTYGGKGFKRYLTDDEYNALRSLPVDESSQSPIGGDGHD